MRAVVVVGMPTSGTRADRSCPRANDGHTVHRSLNNRAGGDAAAGVPPRAVPARVDAGRGGRARRRPRPRCRSRSPRWPARSATPLVEPDGRRVRLTPAGRRLAGARRDHPGRRRGRPASTSTRTAEPAGTVRVAGFATAIRRSLLPTVSRLSRTHPDVRVRGPRARTARGVRAARHRRPRPRPDLRLQPRAALACDRTLRRSALVDAVGPGRAGRRRRTRAAPRSRCSAASATGDWIVNSRNTADDARGPHDRLDGRLRAARHPPRRPASTSCRT